ncbi:MAG: Rv3235 family protein [Actinomycetales bacterium]
MSIELHPLVNHPNVQEPTPSGGNPRTPGLRGLPGGGQQRLPLQWEVAPGVSAVPELPRHLRVVGSAALAEPAVMGEPAPPPAGLIARLARAVAEVGTGVRPATQLATWVQRDALALLEARGRAFQRHPSARAAAARAANTRSLAQVRAIRICPVGPGAVETSAVLVGTNRSRAVAMRLEAQGERWQVVAISLG